MTGEHINIQPIEFTAWPKTPRLFRDMTITEKIDGTNAAVIVQVLQNVSAEEIEPRLRDLNAVAAVEFDNQTFIVGAQSRKRMIFPGADNYGFAAWVKENAFGLAINLGAGTHYGEWWGSGIQRGYGLTGPANKRFSLFNVARYGDIVRNNALTESSEAWVPNLRVVPVLAEESFSEARIREVLNGLENSGSVAETGYAKPEGIIVFHSAAQRVFKVLIENDESPKGAVA